MTLLVVTSHLGNLSHWATTLWSDWGLRSSVRIRATPLSLARMQGSSLLHPKCKYLPSFFPWVSCGWLDGEIQNWHWIEKSASPSQLKTLQRPSSSCCNSFTPWVGGSQNGRSWQKIRTHWQWSRKLAFILPCRNQIHWSSFSRQT